MADQKLGEEAVASALAGVPEWQREGDAIRRQVVLGDFVAAMAVVNKVAEAAEAADHHPDILISYKRVTFTLSTHSAGGLTDKDFAMARSIDGLLAGQPG